MSEAEALPEPFRWCAAGVAIELEGGRALFTGFADGDFAPREDQLPGQGERAAAHVGIPVERWAQDHQVHEHRVRVIAAGDDVRPFTADADGQATARRDAAVAVRTADCLPIALIAPEAVAMVHAGWRGLADGIVEAGITTLHELGATRVAAAIGPGAGVCCYETGDEVHAAFEHLGPGMRVGPRADLKAVARALLEQWAVEEVHDCGLCTICAPPGWFFSYRREGVHAGRQVGVAWRT